MNLNRSCLTSLLCAIVLTFSYTNVRADQLHLSVKANSSRAQVVSKADSLVKEVARRMAALSALTIKDRMAHGLWPNNLQLSFPMVVRLGLSTGESTASQHFNHVSKLKGGGGHPWASDLILQFDTTGTEAFPTTYQQLLQNVFDSAKATMNLLFGQPSVGGIVHVANFDASIGDRQASAGGYYLPDNGSGVPEIRFPVYNQNEAAAVNFVHCLLLAYLGPNGYSTDAFEEGIVRAVTMRVVRTAGALPTSLDGPTLESDLEATYDVGSTYDWNNQRALGGPQFIAPNLISEPLPASGGAGLYLTRYEMAGTAWAKVLTEYPTFASSLNADVYATPSLGGNVAGLTTAAQQILTTSNPASPTVEGLTFADWFQRQFILQTNLTQGKKMFLLATPITSGLQAPDFGVFILEATYFSTDSTGNETLLSGTCYPIFWDATYNRFTTTAQDQVINIAGSQGDIAPSFTDLYAGQPYRVTVDAPVGGNTTRVYLPSGAIATAANPALNDFYGTVSGVTIPNGSTAEVQLVQGSTVLGTYPVTNDAFGATVGALGGYSAGNHSYVINVMLANGATVFSRTVDKTEPGGMGVDLRNNGTGNFAPTGGLPAGISMVGLSIDPFTSDAPTLFNLSASQLLFARFDSNIAAYDLFPNTEAPTGGHAYFVNLPAAQPNFSINGYLVPNVTSTVALGPGWNMVTTPINQTVPLTSVSVVHTTDFPALFTDAAGTTVGVDFFQFVPGPADPITGSPQGGTFLPATQFQAGVGYFVRVLAPEGVSLAFAPATTDGPGGNLGGGLPTGGLPNGSGAHQKASGIDGWLMKSQVNTGGAFSYVILGESPAGSNIENDQVDSSLPPGIGGLQASSVKGNPLFRDIRPFGTRQTYKLHVSGLTYGNKINLSFEMLEGIIHTFKVVDPATGRTYTAMPNSHLTFTAIGSSETFLVEVTGH